MLTGNDLGSLAFDQPGSGATTSKTISILWKWSHLFRGDSLTNISAPQNEQRQDTSETTLSGLSSSCRVEEVVTIGVRKHPYAPLQVYNSRSRLMLYSDLPKIILSGGWVTQIHAEISLSLHGPSTSHASPPANMFSYSRRKPKSLGEGDNPADVHIAPNPIASDESTFQLYRSFGYLQSRMLLDLHAGLRDLENELHTLENSDESEDYVASVRSRGVLSPKTKLYPTDRKSLLHAMEQKLASYESCLLNASRLDELLGNRGRKAKLSSIRCRAAVQEYSASDRDLCNDAEDPIRGGLHLSTPRVQPELVLHPLRRNELMWGGKTRARTLSAMVFMGSLPLAHAAETGGGADSQTFLRHATIPDLVLWGFVLPSVVALWYSGSISTDPSFVGMLMMACLWGAEAGTSSLRDLRPT